MHWSYIFLALIKGLGSWNGKRNKTITKCKVIKKAMIYFLLIRLFMPENK